MKARKSVSKNFSQKFIEFPKNFKCLFLFNRYYNIQNSKNNLKEGEISVKEIIFTLKNIYVYLKSKLLIIVFVGFFGGAIGLVFAYFQKATYTASLSFALEDEKSNSNALSGALGLASTLGIDLGTSAGGAFTGANLMELMKSRTLVEKALLNPISDTILLK